MTPVRIVTRLSVIRMRVLPRKSKWGFLRISIASLDAEGRDLALPDDPVEEEPAHEERGEDVRDEPSEEGDGEPLDRPGPELEEEDGGDQCCRVGVHDREEHTVEPVRDGGLHGLAVAKLLPDPLEHEDVRVDPDADREDDPGDPR